jgi:hypothetical protein
MVNRLVNRRGIMRRSRKRKAKVIYHKEVCNLKQKKIVLNNKNYLFEKRKKNRKRK